MSVRVLIGNAPEGGLLFACIDPEVRFIEPGVARTRFAAILHPFPFEERAKAALIMAGAADVREYTK